MREYLGYVNSKRQALGIEDEHNFYKDLTELCAAQEAATGKPLLLSDEAGMDAVYEKYMQKIDDDQHLSQEEYDELFDAMSISEDNMATLARDSMVEEAAWEMDQLKREAAKYKA